MNERMNEEERKEGIGEDGMKELITEEGFFSTMVLG